MASDKLRGVQFATVPVWVLEHPTLTSNAKIVYARLSAYANEKSQAWPSIKLMAEKLGISKSNVGRAVQELVAAGVIACVKVKSRRTDGSFTTYNKYTLRYRQKSKQKPESHIPRAGRAPVPTGGNASPTGGNASPTGGINLDPMIQIQQIQIQSANAVASADKDADVVAILSGPEQPQALAPQLDSSTTQMATAGAPPARKIPDTPHHRLVALYFRLFENLTGEKPATNGGDYALLAKLVKEHGEPMVQSNLMQFFTSTDNFIRSGSYTLKFFHHVFNKLTIERTRPGHDAPHSNRDRQNIAAVQGAIVNGPQLEEQWSQLFPNLGKKKEQKKLAP